jgi:hypothetical protein
MGPHSLTLDNCYASAPSSFLKAELQIVSFIADVRFGSKSRLAQECAACPPVDPSAPHFVLLVTLLVGKRTRPK